MLSTSALTVKLSISRFGMRKKDAVVTDETNRNYNAVKDAGNYNKALFNLKDPLVAAVQAAASEARKYHAEMTLPWGERGERCLPSKVVMEYRDQMENVYKPKFMHAVTEFVDAYARLKSQAEIDLGMMFNENDYPPVSKVEEAFDFSITLEPIADPSDFRLKIQESELERLKAEYAANNEAKTQAAMADLWNRLYTVVAKMATTLDDDEKTFKNTLVGNIASLTEILPRLNMANDPALDAMSRKINEELCTYTPDDLRKNKEVRKETSKTAKEICEAMQGYMGNLPKEEAA